MRFVNFIRVAIILLFGGLMSANAQKYTYFDNFRVATELNEDGRIAVYSNANGTTMIEGSKKLSDGKPMLPILAFDKYQQGGDNYTKFYLGYLNYNHDSSANDRNYFTIEFIGDANMNKVVKATGRVYNDYGWTTFKFENNDDYAYFFNTLKESNYLYIRTSANGNTNQVIKISLKGYSKAINTAHARVKASSNPFSNSNNSSNPFKG